MTRYEVELTPEQAEGLLEVWGRVRPETPAIAALVDAVRANPPKPPRMNEPGWGQIVTACTREGGKRRRFVHITSTYPWMSETGESWRWDQLTDPEPVDGAR